MRETLKDPESARFGDFYYNSKTKKGCLAVNAKNSMGGYTGDQQALLFRNGNGWDAPAVMEWPASLCREMHADKSNADNTPPSD